MISRLDESLEPFWDYITYILYISLSEIIFFCFLQVGNFFSIKIKLSGPHYIKSFALLRPKVFWLVCNAGGIQKVPSCNVFCFCHELCQVRVALLILASVLTMCEFYFSSRDMFLLRSFLMQKNGQTSSFNVELLLYAGSKFKSLLVLPFPYPSVA